MYEKDNVKEQQVEETDSEVWSGLIQDKEKTTAQEYKKRRLFALDEINKDEIQHQPEANDIEEDDCLEKTLEKKVVIKGAKESIETEDDKKEEPKKLSLTTKKRKPPCEEKERAPAPAFKQEGVLFAVKKVQMQRNPETGQIIFDF
eukprot:Awhi_evm1s4969